MPPLLSLVRCSLATLQDPGAWVGQAAGAALAGALILASFALLPLILRTLPPDYFARPDAPPTPWATQHPQARLITGILRNAVGAFLLAAGLVMLVLPGQGILTLVAALILLDFPGKRRLELSLVSRPTIFRALNWVRTRTHRPPFLEPPHSPRSR